MPDLDARSGTDYTTLCARLQEPAHCKDAEGRFLTANAAAMRQFSMGGDVALLGRRLSELQPSEETRRVEQNDREVMASRRSAVVEETLRVDGEPRVFLTTKLPLSDADGRVEALLSISVDLSRSAGSQARMRARAQRLRRGLRAAGEDVYSWNPHSGRFGAGSRLHEVVGEAGLIPDLDAWRARLHPDDRAAHSRWCDAMRCLNEGTLDLEYRVRHADGRWLWIWERAIVSRGTGRSRVTSNLSNISERKALEERQLTALDAAQIGLWSADADGLNFLPTPRARILLDLDDQENATLPALAARILPGDRPRALRTWLKLLRDRREPPHPLLLRLRLRDGRLRWIETTLRAVLASEEGPTQVTALVGTVTDVGARVHAESELRTSGDRFRQLVENLGDVFWMVDWRQRKQLYVSPACERLWGYAPEKIYAASPHWAEMIHPLDRARVDAALAALDTEGDFESEYRLLCADGRTGWVRDRAVAMRDADGRVERILGVAEDVTERRQLARSSLERERRLQLALDAARFHVWTFDVHHHRISVADGLCQVLGLSPRQCAWPGTWRRRIHPEDRARIEQAFRHCLNGGPDIDVEFRTPLAGGDYGWLALRATLLADEDSGTHLYGLCEDISSRRADEVRLRDSEQQLRTLNDSIPVGIARCSRDRRYRFVNRAYAREVLACPAEVVPGRRIEEIIGMQAADLLEPHFRAVLAGETVELALSVPYQRVGRRNIIIRLVPERDGERAVVGWIEVIDDVTERARVERLLYQRNREFKTLVENAPDIIARLDTGLRYLYVNEAIRTLLGLDPAAFTGLTGRELQLPHAMREASERAARAAFASGEEQPASFEAELDGQTRFFSARLIPEFDSDNRIESVLMVVYDVTERTRAQRERDRLHTAECDARERAEAAARARDQFLAIVSHELRSPLNGIQNWSNVLEGQIGANASGVMWRALAGIKNGVDQQVRLIEDLLDATRIMSGNLSLSMQAVEIRPVVDAAIASVSAPAAAKNIALVQDLQVEHEQVFGDPDRLQQIIWNLLSNALKFSAPGGQVEVSLQHVGQGLSLRVSDQGRGIDPDFLPYMFEWFRRDDTSSHRGTDGLGLGLALVRHLCELHGGSVAASSPGPGLGASFEVRLPLLSGLPASLASHSGEPPTMPRSLPSLAALRVLVIDDQQDAREALAALLGGMQAQVRVFASGAQALAFIRKQGVLRCAEVLLCDIAMPGEDGYAVLSRLRTLEKDLGLSSEQRLPAIALTAFAQREERQRAIEAGFALHLSKPVSAEDLAAAVLRVARRAP